jgi:GNAT superfamily N-acetyltransferase
MPVDHQRPAGFPPIRRLGPADLKRCVALSLDRGWSPERAKWSLLLAASEVFGVDAPDGRGLAGAVVLTRWGPDLASVGMMLVAARYGRRGLGRALMEHLLAAAGEGAAVTLFATDMGRPLYERLGFAPVRRNVSFLGRFRPPPSGFRPPPSDVRPSPSGLRPPPSDFRPAPSDDNSKKRGMLGRARRLAPSGGPDAPGLVRLAGRADMPAILAVDRAAFGADRGAIVGRLPGFADRIAVIENGDGIAGYAAAWRNHVTSTVIGPLVAPDAEAATQLIAELAARVRTPVRLDLDPDRPELPDWAHAHGLEPVSRTVVMAHGDLKPRGAPERLYTPISVALA